MTAPTTRWTTSPAGLASRSRALVLPASSRLSELLSGCPKNLVFSNAEQRLCHRRADLTGWGGRLAAKFAVCDLLGVDAPGALEAGHDLGLAELEILPEPHGLCSAAGTCFKPHAPHVVMSPAWSALIQAGERIQISISHTRQLAIALAVRAAALSQKDGEPGMTWWQAYGRDKAIDQMINAGAKENESNPVNEETMVFTGHYTPGDKPLTVVLLPALFVGDWMWEGIYNRLNAAGWPVIQFTESISLVDRQTARSINRIAARLLEATRKQTAQPLVVAGDSLGGLIAFEFARSFPDQTAGLVASGAPGLNLKVNEFARDLAVDVTSPVEFADKFLGKLLYDPSAHNIDPERYQAVVNELAEPDNLTSMMSAVRAINRYNSRKVVMEIDTPKLFLWGRQDEITPPQDWERALPRMKNARMVVFDECGHGPMFEKPDEFYAELVVFLEELVDNMTPAQKAQAERQQRLIEAAAKDVESITSAD